MICKFDIITWYSGFAKLYRCHSNMYIYIYVYRVCIIMYIYIYISGGQNYSLPAMDMAKVGGPLSVVKVCTSMLRAKIGYR